MTDEQPIAGRLERIRAPEQQAYAVDAISGWIDGETKRAGRR
jgi:hypothetical protein